MRDLLNGIAHAGDFATYRDRRAARVDAIHADRLEEYAIDPRYVPAGDRER